MPELIVPWELRPNNAEKDPNANSEAFNTAPSTADWKLSISSSSCCLPQCAAIVDREENPPSEQYAPLSTSQPPPSSGDMAYQHADPAPFIPEGMQHEDIANREFMVRAVAPVHPPARNEDIQSTNLGQALVRLTHTYDRDTLVRESPHVYDNINVTFHKHNEG